MLLTAEIANKELIPGELLGLHQFVAYEGDVEYEDYEFVEDIIHGKKLLVPKGPPINPVVFESDIVKNLIVTNGKNLMMDRLFNLASAVALGQIGVGTDPAAAAVGQVQLNPVTAGSVLIQAADAGTSRSGQTVTIKSTFGTSVANFQWNEAAIFNGTVNGTSVMFNRVVIGPFTKSTAVSIVYTTTVTQG